ncbi:MAG: cobalamin-binding protein [Burkholderiales bacterium]
MTAPRTRFGPLARALIAVSAITSSSAAGASVEVVTADGSRLRLEAPARRIVSLAPHATELIYAAGAGSRLVGVHTHSDYPPAARQVRTVGDAGAIDVEGIVALKPDLVVTWPWTVPAQVERLRALGIPILVTLPDRPGAIADEIERIGVLTGTPATASAAAAEFRARLARVVLRHRDASPVSVFYEVSDKPLFTLGGDHLVSQAIAACGGRNVFSTLKVPAPEVDVEAVLSARPDVIVAGTAGAVRPAWLDQWRRWPSLPAAVHGNLYAVDADLLHRPGPRFVAGVEALCAALDEARARAR